MIRAVPLDRPEDARDARASLRTWLGTPLESADEAVITIDPDGRIRGMNAGAEALAGWTAAEAAGRPCADVFVPGPTPDTLRFARDPGQQPIVHSRVPVRDADGGMLGTVILFRDQADERAQLRALEQSERRHRELFAANPQAMWIYDEQSLRFLDVNASAVARYGYSRDEFLAMTLADIRPPEDVPALVDDAAAVPDGFEGGRRWRHRRKDGSLLAVEIRPIPCRGRGGALASCSCTTSPRRAHSRTACGGRGRC